MLHVQKFLMNRESVKVTPLDMLERLKAETGAKFSIWNNLVVLNYCQIESRKTDPIAQECRSLVLELGTWDIVSRSFNRFFNYGEAPCPAVDITRLTACEKVDGSLIGLFNYKGEWLYRTRSMIMPENTINAWEVTWKEHIETALGENYKTRLNGFEHNTFILELTSPENRIVTRYGDAPQMTLLAIRDNEQGHYETRDRLWDYTLNGIPEWRKAHTYKFETVSDCLIAAKALRNLEEGFVLYNRHGEPVCKVKNPAYVAAHHLRGEGLNPRRIKDLIFMNEMSEYLTIFPEDEKMFDPYIMAHMKLMASVEGTMIYLEDKEMTQKEFAIRIQDLPYKGLLFTMRKGLTLKEAWARCTTNTKYSLVDGMMK